MISDEMMRRVDIVLQDLGKEIAELPGKQVWTCKSTDQIEELINRMERFIDYCYQSMAGTIDKTRDMLSGMIDIAEDEIEEAKAVQYSLKQGM